MHSSSNNSLESSSSSISKKQLKPDDQFRPEQLLELSADLSGKMAAAVREFDKINLETQILSINAAVEAARAGAAGASFAVVAGQMKQLSGSTGKVAYSLSHDVQVALEKINDFSSILSTQVRGTRLADLALNNIDLIDRNLYERSCDVRWWATDSSVWNACENPAEENLKYVSNRLGVILDAYTVYYDLVLCNLAGEVIANGRPDQYNSKGVNCSEQGWFKQAASSNSSNEFGFQPVHSTELVDGKSVLTYSCSVRAEGHSDGAIVGVLGILFNWDALAGVILQQTQLSPREWERSRVCIVDEEGRLLADSDHENRQKGLELEYMSDYFKYDKTFKMDSYHGKETLIAYAKAPGYETYTTGWHSFIIQHIN